MRFLRAARPAACDRFITKTGESPFLTTFRELGLASYVQIWDTNTTERKRNGGEKACFCNLRKYFRYLAFLSINIFLDLIFGRCIIN